MQHDPDEWRRETRNRQRGAKSDEETGGGIAYETFQLVSSGQRGETAGSTV